MEARIALAPRDLQVARLERSALWQNELLRASCRGFCPVQNHDILSLLFFLGSGLFKHPKAYGRQLAVPYLCPCSNEQSAGITSKRIKRNNQVHLGFRRFHIRCRGQSDVGDVLHFELAGAWNRLAPVTSDLARKT